MISTLFLIGVGLVVVLLTYLQTQIVSPSPNIPGLVKVPGWPVVGNLLQLRRASSWSETLEKWAVVFGPIYQIR